MEVLEHLLVPAGALGRHGNFCGGIGAGRFCSPLDNVRFWSYRRQTSRVSACECLEVTGFVIIQ